MNPMPTVVAQCGVIRQTLVCVGLIDAPDQEPMPPTVTSLLAHWGLELDSPTAMLVANSQEEVSQTLSTWMVPASVVTEGAEGNVAAPLGLKGLARLVDRYARLHHRLIKIEPMEGERGNVPDIGCHRREAHAR